MGKTYSSHEETKNDENEPANLTNVGSAISAAVSNMYTFNTLLPNKKTVTRPMEPLPESEPDVSNTNLVALYDYNITLFVALYDYDARTDEDLSFHKGVHLEILDDTQGEWWFARNNISNREGYIPSNFVARLKSIEAES